MTRDKIALVQTSWPKVAANIHALTTRFYEHLFEIDDSAAKLFAGVDMVAQREKLAQSLAIVVASLDNLEQLVPHIAALGKRHVNYGVEERHYDSVGDALLWALRDTLGTSFTTELHEAWAEAYTLIASVMQRALARQNAPAAARLE